MSALAHHSQGRYREFACLQIIVLEFRRPFGKRLALITRFVLVRRACRDASANKNNHARGTNSRRMVLSHGGTDIMA